MVIKCYSQKSFLTAFASIKCLEYNLIMVHVSNESRNEWYVVTLFIVAFALLKSRWSWSESGWLALNNVFVALLCLFAELEGIACSIVVLLYSDPPLPQ